MNRINVCFALGVVGGLSASLTTDQLLAQARYPDKAIRIVVAAAGFIECRETVTAR